MKNYLIIGAGSVGRIIIDIIETLNNRGSKITILGFLDDDIKKGGSDFFGYKVLGNTQYLKSVKDISVIIAFADSNYRKNCYEKIKKFNNDLNYPTILSPYSIIGNNVNIGKGTIVFPGVIIDPEVSLGDFCQVNKSVTLGHDTIIEDFVTISPGVNIGGLNHLFERCFIGIGSCTIQQLKIGRQSKIGAGTIVIKDVPDYATVVGNPAKIIKYKITENE